MDAVTKRAFEAMQGQIDGLRAGQTRELELRSNLSGSIASSITVLSGSTASSITALSGTVSDLHGRYLGRQIFTVSGTYNPTSGTNSVLLRMVGGGGSGGGSQGGTSTYSAGAGGSSGVYLEKFIDPGSAITGGAIIIGSAGAVVQAGAGNAGQLTSAIIQGTTYGVSGGLGGGFISPTGGTSTTFPGGYTTAGSSIGDFTLQGPGTAPLIIYPSAAYSGAGGSCPLGQGGLQRVTAGAGSDGTGYGSGGGGSISTTLNSSSGAGAPGIVIIDEYS